MNQPRPTFRQVSEPLDIADDDLAKFSESRGLPSLVTPVRESPPIDPQPAQDASNEPPRTPTSPKTPAAKKPAPASKRASATSKLSLMVPTYVSDAVNLRAAQDRCSSRYLVLQGLKAIGLPIDDADLVPDARRSAPKRR